VSWTADGASATIAAVCDRAALPDNAVTIYLPSSGSVDAQGGTNANAAIQAGTLTVVINVDGAGQVSTTDDLCLVPVGSGCTQASVNAGSAICRDISFANDQFTFTIDRDWATVAAELEDTARNLCIRKGPAGPGVYTGLKIASVFNCDVDADCTAHPGINRQAPYNNGLVSLLESRVLASRATCCKNTDLGLGVGICINQNVQSCCGGVALESIVERCCDATNHRIRGIDQACPCFGANNGAAAALGCPTGESCCLPSRFVEFDTVANIEGRCYNSETARCCNTGELYDPGTAQCCVINGIQSLNNPCPCDQDSHCAAANVLPNGTQIESTLRCCRQRFPTPTQPAQCTAFANFPSRIDTLGVAITNVRDNLFRPGDNVATVQRCPGVCIDTRFQMCCNGIACVQGYEKCCNNTCCNKFVGKCAESYRAGGLSSSSNAVDFNAPFEICTIIENLGPLKTYWVFVLPTFLLVATLSSLALVIIYSSSQSTRAFSFIERAIVVLAVLIVLFACPLFFSPAYKYGVVMVVVGLIAILSASARVWWLNVLALGAAIVLLLFFVDPFHGNQFWNFANGRLFNGHPDFEQMGVLHTIDKMFTGTANWQRQDFCVQFYDYFALDPNLQDQDRRDNAAIGTFGFCVREWVAALLILELFALLLALLLFVLLVLALTLRFRKVAPLPAIVEPAYVDIY